MERLASDPLLEARHGGHEGALLGHLLGSQLGLGGRAYNAVQYSTVQYMRELCSDTSSGLSSDWRGWACGVL